MYFAIPISAVALHLYVPITMHNYFVIVIFVDLSYPQNWTTKENTRYTVTAFWEKLKNNIH
jgi:hypothetical protein